MSSGKLNISTVKSSHKVWLLLTDWWNLWSMEYLVCCSFVVENLYREGAYLLSANISQCYEANQDCGVNHVLFVNSLLPKSVCDWSSDYKIASKLWNRTYFTTNIAYKQKTHKISRMQLTRTLFLCCQLVPMTKLSIIVYAFPLYTDISLTFACLYCTSKF